jgi:hypothetical protein
MGFWFKNFQNHYSHNQFLIRDYQPFEIYLYDIIVSLGVNLQNIFLEASGFLIFLLKITLH